MARERVVKYPPKRGKLKRSDMRRAVREVMFGKSGDGAGGQTHSITTIKVGRDAKTGRFISCEEAERRTGTAMVETIKIPKKKR